MSETTELLDKIIILLENKYVQYLIIGIVTLKIAESIKILGKCCLYIWAFFKRKQENL